MTTTLPAARTVPPVAREARLRAAVVASPMPREPHVDAESPGPDIVDIWGLDSFPASDAPANW
jgi:hypothetical protein